MPYVEQQDRRISDYQYGTSLDDMIEGLAEQIEFVANHDENKLEGLINYAVSRLIAGVLAKDGWRYYKLNKAVGVLECIKLELYRRIGGPYEDKAIKKNGDIAEYEEFHQSNNK